MGYETTISFGELTLLITRLTAIKVPGTIKQVVGRKIILRPVPAMTTQDWQIDMDGNFIDTNRETDRTTLHSYDDQTTHTLVDGIHNGNYFVQSMQIFDEGNRPVKIGFKITLIQHQ